MRRVISLLASVATIVFALPASPVNATFPGRNGLIAFGAETRHSGYELFTVQANGEDLSRITHVDGNAFNPDWSPDGAHMAFQLEDEEGPVFCSIQLMNADGTDLVDLTTAHNPDGWEGCEHQPSFTPDGTHIVFGRYDAQSDTEAIWSMDLTGNGRVQVTDGIGRGVTDPNVSPDGATVSFIAYNGEDLGQALMSSALDGADVERLVPFRLDVAIKHDWAPDGDRIVFTDNADRFTKPANIATVRPDGTGLRYLTDLGSPKRRAYTGGYSPDGRWIVFRLEVGDRAALYRMHPDGTNRREILPFSSFRPRFIDWGPQPTE